MVIARLSLGLSFLGLRNFLKLCHDEKPCTWWLGEKGLGSLQSRLARMLHHEYDALKGYRFLGGAISFYSVSCMSDVIFNPSLLNWSSLILTVAHMIFHISVHPMSSQCRWSCLFWSYLSKFHQISPSIQTRDPLPHWGEAYSIPSYPMHSSDQFRYFRTWFQSMNINRDFLPPTLSLHSWKSMWNLQISTWKRQLIFHPPSCLGKPAIISSFFERVISLGSALYLC